MAALLIDLDGTIADSAAGILACLRETLAEFDAAPDADADLRWVIGPPIHVIAERLLGGQEHVEACVSAYRRRYAATGLQRAEPFGGVPAELRRLHASGHALYVCTSKVTAFAEQILARFGLTDVFAGIYGGDPSARVDDKVALAGRIIAKHRLEPEAACLIGDRREDVQAGRANGLATLGVLWGYGSREELVGAGAHRLCEAPAALTADLGVLMGGA